MIDDVAKVRVPEAVISQILEVVGIRKNLSTYSINWKTDEDKSRERIKSTYHPLRLPLVGGRAMITLAAKIS